MRIATPAVSVGSNPCPVGRGVACRGAAPQTWRTSVYEAFLEKLRLCIFPGSELRVRTHRQSKVLRGTFRNSISSPRGDFCLQHPKISTAMDSSHVALIGSRLPRARALLMVQASEEGPQMDDSPLRSEGLTLTVHSNATSESWHCSSNANGCHTVAKSSCTDSRVTLPGKSTTREIRHRCDAQSGVSKMNSTQILPRQVFAHCPCGRTPDACVGPNSVNDGA